MSKPRMLGVLLCYNDGDILADAITALLNANHDVIAWNHGSSDDTADVLKTFRRHLVETQHISRDVDFYDMYPNMSRHLLREYVARYDWISWPDQDELLEGPSRARSYDDYVREVWESGDGWIEFLNFVFWFTDRDDPAIVSPVERVRYYSLFPGVNPLVRSWRASATNIRWFNHNAAAGARHPTSFNLRHYPMRSAAQMRRRILKDRAGIRKGSVNFHYETLKARLDSVCVRAEQLHYDDGRLELSQVPSMDWRAVYGDVPRDPLSQDPAAVLSTLRPQVAWRVATLLSNRDATSGLWRTHADRISRWIAHARDQGDEVAVVIVDGAETSRVITESPSSTPLQGVINHDTAAMTTVRLHEESRAVGVVVADSSRWGRDPLVAMVSVDEAPYIDLRLCENGAVQFRDVPAGRFVVALEPMHTESGTASVSSTEPAW
jgi:hypothetical protein